MQCCLQERARHLDSRWVVGVFAALMIPFFPPEIIHHLGTSFLIDGYAWGGMASAALCFLCYAVFGRKDVFSLAGVGISILILISTITRDGALNLWFSKWLPCCASVMLVASFGRTHTRELLWALFLVTFGLSVTNLASVLLMPEGVYATSGTAQSGNFLYGNKDSFYRILFPALCASCALDALSGRWVSLRSAIVLVVAVMSVVLATSAATLMALGFFVIGLLCTRWCTLRRYLNGISVTVGGVAAFLAIVVFRLQHLFDFLIVDVLGKSLTFTGRTLIWDKVFELSGLRGLFFGRGVSGYRELVVDGRQYYHAHDGVLDLWLNGGLMSLLFLAIMACLVALVLYRFRRQREAGVYAIALGAFYLNGITEPIVCASLLMILSLAYYSFASVSPDQRCAKSPSCNLSSERGFGCAGAIDLHMSS